MPIKAFPKGHKAGHEERRVCLSNPTLGRSPIAVKGDGSRSIRNRGRGCNPSKPIVPGGLHPKRGQKWNRHPRKSLGVALNGGQKWPENCWWRQTRFVPKPVQVTRGTNLGRDKQPLLQNLVCEIIILPLEIKSFHNVLKGILIFQP